MTATRRAALRLGLAALAAPVVLRAARAADPVAIRLDWSTWGSHAPFHLALARGWFARHGLDVTLEDGNGSVATVQLVGNGQFDLGHASLAPMMLARGRGIPVRAIAGIVKRNDIGLILPQGSSTRVADLRGKRLAYTPSSLETPFLDRFLAAGNLTRADVELLSIDGAAKTGTYVAGRCDAVFSSVPDQVARAHAGRVSTAIRFADQGLAFPSFGLFATERAIADKPDVLKRVVAVVAGTWTYILAGHEAEAVTAMQAARPQARLQTAVLAEQIELLKEFMPTPATQGRPMGSMALADCEEGARTMADARLIERPVPTADYFTNDLVDPATIAAVAGGAA